MKMQVQEQPHQGRPSLKDDDELSHETNYGFAINKKEFSDRLLDLIATSDEEAAKEMLWFCYDEKLCQRIITGPKGVDFLLKVLRIGHQFHCKPVMRKALSELRGLPQTCSLADTISARLKETQNEDLLEFKELQELLNNVFGILLWEYGDISTWSLPEFKSLKLESVKALLESDNLLAASEEEILNGVLAWVRSAYRTVTDRRIAMLQLAEHLRFAVMSGEYLQTILSVSEMKLCQKAIMSAVWYRAFSEARRLEMQGEKASDMRYIERTDVFQGVRRIRRSFQREAMKALVPFGRSLMAECVQIKGHTFMMCPQRCKTEDNPDGCPTVLVNYVRVSEDAPKLDTLIITLYAKTWPEGGWQEFGTLYHDVTDPLAGRVCVGRCDISKKAWSTFINSSTWFGKDGQLHVQMTILPFFE